MTRAENFALQLDVSFGLGVLLRSQEGAAELNLRITRPIAGDEETLDQDFDVLRGLLETHLRQRFEVHVVSIGIRYLNRTPHMTVHLVRTAPQKAPRRNHALAATASR